MLVKLLKAFFFLENVRQVPPNVRATVHVPASAGQGVMEGGAVLEGGRRETGSVVFEVGSGDYEFVAYTP